MPAPAAATDQLRKKARVTAAVDLRDVPAGTPGRVMMVSGLSWIRYWVRFDNGVSLGSLSRDQLVTKAQLEAGDEVEVGGEEAGEAAVAGGGDDGGAAGGVATPSGTLVPQKLLDRAKAARARLGG